MSVEYKQTHPKSIFFIIGSHDTRSVLQGYQDQFDDLIFLYDPTQGTWETYKRPKGEPPLNYVIDGYQKVFWFMVGFNETEARNAFESAYNSTSLQRTTWGRIKKLYK